MYRYHKRKRNNTRTRWIVFLAVVIVSFWLTDGYTRLPFMPQAENTATYHQLLQDNQEEGYREDEQILLKLATTDILELERKKDYGKIYDQYASQALKRSLARRDFLKMGRCLEVTMGDLVDYQRDQWDFTRNKTEHGTLDSTTRSVVRAGGNVKEQLTYVREGIDFKLNAIYWSSARKDFLSCMNQVMEDIRKAQKQRTVEKPPKPPGVKSSSSTAEKPKPATDTPPPSAKSPAPAGAFASDSLPTAAPPKQTAPPVTAPQKPSPPKPAPPAPEKKPPPPAAPEPKPTETPPAAPAPAELPPVPPPPAEDQ
jgi:hypothetical protein